MYVFVQVPIYYLILQMAVNQLGEFALIIGDLHIPQRANGVPEQFKELLLPNKMQYVLASGNIGSKEVSQNGF